MCWASGTEARRVVGENFLAGLGVEFGKIPRSRIEHNIALPSLGEAEMMKNFGNREQFVDFQLQVPREFRQVRLAVVGRRCNSLD